MPGTSEPSNSGEHSTPYLQNVSAHSQANASATFDEVDPYIVVNDMKNNYAMPFDKFLLGLGADKKGITIRDKNDAFITGYSSDQFISMRTKGYGEKRKATALYDPFSNHIISNLDNGKVVFSRNDPNCISELRGNSHRPVIVSLDRINDSVANDRWKDFNGSEPTGVKWIWSDFRFISGFKYPEHTKPNTFDPAVNSELGGGEGWTCKSETKVDPKGSLGGKGARNCFLLDNVDIPIGGGCSRARVLGKPCKPHNRVWHCLAYEYLLPLYKVTEISEFKQAVRDIALGHHLLATSYIRILHRDISLHNVLVQIRNDVIRGVLNDWDLAKMEPHTNIDHSGECTGTRPFMAIDLLVPQPPRYMERFDWESFLYVICMIACRYDKGEDINPDALSRWCNPDDVILQALKFYLLNYGKDPEDATDLYRQVNSDWIKPLRRLLADGYREQSKHSWKKLSTPFTSEVPFDNETLGGRVTWEKFWEILQK